MCRESGTPKRSARNLRRAVGNGTCPSMPPTMFARGATNTFVGAYIGCAAIRVGAKRRYGRSRSRLAPSRLTRERARPSRTLGCDPEQLASPGRSRRPWSQTAAGRDAAHDDEALDPSEVDRRAGREVRGSSYSFANAPEGTSGSPAASSAASSVAAALARKTWWCSS